MPKNIITQYLFKQGKISGKVLKKILAEAKEVSLAPDEFLETKKIVNEEEVAQAKSAIYELPYVDIYGLTVPREILNIIPKETAEHYQITAFKKEDNILSVAILNPDDYKAREAVDFTGRRKNLKTKFFVPTTSGLKNVLTQYSGLAVEVEEAVTAAEARFAPVLKGERTWAEISKEEISKAAPITKLVSSVLTYAVDNNASDVHIEPLADKTRIRCRIDGVLKETAMLPLHLHSAIVSRVKVMANLKLDETRIPQDGRIRLVVSKRRIDLRVSTYPLLGAEKAVMRILDPTKMIYTLKGLGFWGRGKKIIEKALLRPHGMILLTGPTGCGKTTTLYAIMKILNQVKVNIVTLEDPIEYYLEGVNQSQVKPDIGYTFASGLRSVIRQDPDVIMVGEIRDKETAELATHAALTGHVVLSTLHTNDAFGAVPRLIDMGIEPFLISSSLSMVVAQRLVRKICEHCKKKVVPLPGAEKMIKEALKANDEINLADYIDKKQGVLNFYRGQGCSRCANDGYKGRTAIFEALEITDQMKDIIVSGCKLADVRKEFARQKMTFMLNDGYIKTLQGITTLEEVLRVARE